MGNIPGAGGTTTSFTNTPQAKDDQYSLAEDFFGITYFDVMSNDLGGNAKTLFSIDNGTNQTGTMSGYSAGDLTSQDTARTETTSLDKSAKGAKIWISADGKVGYDAATLDPAFKTAVQALHTGQTLTDTFIYAIRLGNGTLSWATVTVTFLGAEDGATISIVPGGDYCVTEAGGVANGTPGDSMAAGQLAVSDVDAGDNKFQAPPPASLTGTYGTWTFDNLTGQWTYTLDNGLAATQALNAGDVTTETLTVTSWDGSASSTITVQVKGSNDNASIAVMPGSDNGVTEAGGVANATPGDPTAGGQLAVTDVDDGEAYFQTPSSLAGTYGTFTFNPTTGVWGYTLANVQANVQALNAGDLVHDTLTVTSADGTASYTIDVTVTGSNDAATISASATEDTQVDEAGGTANADVGDPSAGGKLTVSDVDQGEAVFQAPASLAGTYGTFTFNPATGVWGYTLANGQANVEALDTGDIVHDTLTVLSADGTASYTIDVAISGTNDAPFVVAEVSDQSTAEDQPYSYNVSGHFDDVDDASATYSATGLPAWLSIDPDTGVLSGTPANGDVGSTTITVIATDDDGATASSEFELTVENVNDAPVVSLEIGDQSTDEDAAYSYDASANFADDDTIHGDTLEYSATGLPAWLSIDPDTGVLSGTPANGDVGSTTITVIATDDDGATASSEFELTVENTDDQPTLAAVTSGSVSEIDQSSSRNSAGLTGFLAGNDVDVGDTLSYGIQGGAPDGPDLVSLAGVHGTLTVNTVTGAYTYAPTASTIEALDAGENPSDVFNVTVSDGTGPEVVQTYTVNFTGADDAPTLAPVASGSVTEVPNSTSTTDSGLTGTLVGADVDVETLTYGVVGGVPAGAGQVSLAGTYGTLTVNTSTGGYTYAKNTAAIEALNAGQNPADVFTVTVSDGDGPLVSQTYTVNVTGANDGPPDLLAPTDIKFSLNEASTDVSGSNLGAGIVLGTLAAVDADSTSWTFTLGGASGGLFTLDPASGLNSSVLLKVAGSSAIGSGTFTFTVTATDGAGHSYLETYNLWVGTTGGGGDGSLAVPILISSGSDIDFGLNGNDVISGGAGDDALIGGQNNDTLNGGLGTDELFGNANNDNFRFQYDGMTTNLALYGVDRILDMNASGDDTIQLDDALFVGIGGPGALSVGVFSNTGAAVDANDRIIYNSATGALSYDADGNGAGLAVQFAQLDAGTVLALADFLVI